MRQIVEPLCFQTVNSLSDTIAAVATAPGEAAISIVRVSGPKSLDVADKIFQGTGPPPSQRKPGTFTHGFVHAPAGCAREASNALDEVILLIFRAPHSYTREDTVEIQGHGGKLSSSRILQATLDAGARVAEPGEFTRRAFLNGRIDLLQAEAVADLIRAKCDFAAASAMEQLKGRLSNELTKCYNVVLEISAEIEARLDLDCDDFCPTTVSGLADRSRSVARDLERLLATWEAGHVLREGALAVIAGRPNVGKSTLLNGLLMCNRAITSSVPGTTRDTIEEMLILDGLPVRLVDTAGLRNARCAVEKEGVARSRARISEADVVLYMVDASRPSIRADRAILATLDARKTLVVLNKSDLGVQHGPDAYHGFRAVLCSAVTAAGLQEVRDGLRRLLPHSDPDAGIATVSGRHRQFVQDALNALNETGRLLADGDDDKLVLAANTLRCSADAIGRVTGTVYGSDLLDAIFSKFCVGK